MATPISLCVIQDRYYVKRAQSIIKATPTFRIAKAVWGNGYTAYDNNDVPYFLDVPKNVTTITNGFFTDSNPTLSVDSTTGDITIKSQLLKGDIPEGEMHEFSAVYLLDQDNAIIAIFNVLPTWMSSERGLEVTGVLERYEQ